jgi:hypothetical protein
MPQVQGGPIGRRQCDVTIYFGQPIHEFDAGLEQLHASLFTLERALLSAAMGATTFYRKEYRETVLDEDRLDACKLMAIQMTVEE